MPSTLTCPSCNATLRPKTPLAAGTRIKCPKCTNVFAVPDEEDDAPVTPVRRPKPAARREEPEEEVPESGEILDDEPEDDEPEEDRPRKKKKKKPKKKGVPLWVWLTAGGGLFLLLCCAGCGGFIWYVGSSVINAGSGAATFLNYAQVQEGMSDSQVKTIMGASPQSAMQIGNTKTETWQSGSDVIVVTFVDDKAVNRSCHLTSKSGQVITQSGFTGH
jgi:Zn-finger nucleic acid-binding protein